MVFYWTDGYCSQLLDKHHLFNEDSFLGNLLQGGSTAMVAEIASLLLYYPFDLIKTRMQCSNDHYKYKNLLDAFIKIWRKSSGRDLHLRLASYYDGMSLFALTYVAYIGI